MAMVENGKAVAFLNIRIFFVDPLCLQNMKARERWSERKSGGERERGKHTESGASEQRK